MRSLNLSVLLLIGVQLSGCATLHGPGRTLSFSAMGAATGAGGGYLFSPNKESKDLNALVFGLAGALFGGIAGLIGDRPDEAVKPASTIFDRSEIGTGSSKEMLVLPQESLPEYVRKRIQPVVVEEFTETDRVGEDGELHEAHKVYRIKRQAEFNSRPFQNRIEPVRQR